MLQRQLRLRPPRGSSPRPSSQAKSDRHVASCSAPPPERRTRARSSRTRRCRSMRVSWCGFLPWRAVFLPASHPSFHSGRGDPSPVADSITLARPLPRLHATEATRHISPRGVRSSVSSHLAESECVSLNTRVEKLDLEFAVADGAALSDELVEALPRDDAPSIGIGVRAVAGAWRRAVDGDAEPDRSTVRRRAEHEMEGAR